LAQFQAADPLAVMTSKSNHEMLQFQELGPRLAVRQLLVKTGVCLVIGSILIACVWATPSSSVNRMLASNPETMPSSNVSDVFSELLNASGKQFGPGGTFGGGPCRSANEVSNIQFCNEGSVSVQPLLAQALGMPGQWAQAGNWIHPNQLHCYGYESWIGVYGVEGFPIGCYFHLGNSRYQPCVGSMFNFKNTSYCAGVYRCRGNPLVCQRSTAVWVR